jgi:uncharacterized membrane protein
MKSTFEALKLLFNYAVHTLITILGFATLVAATLVIHEASKYVEGEFYQTGCKWVEQGLFVLGVLLLAVITLYLTAVLLIDLAQNFRNSGSPALPVTPPSAPAASSSVSSSPPTT